VLLRGRTQRLESCAHRGDEGGSDGDLRENGIRRSPITIPGSEARVPSEESFCPSNQANGQWKGLTGDVAVRRWVGHGNSATPVPVQNVERVRDGAMAAHAR
jgi:hypothetical protein